VPVGAAAAAIIGETVGWKYAPVTGWIVSAAVYLIWTWMIASRMSAEQTASHAIHGAPTWTDLIVVSASIASLAGVGYLLIAASAEGREAFGDAVLGIGSVVVSWFAVHTVFALRYARLYYSDPPGGIDFNQTEPPSYVDFAYLAFSIGMTYQVSDTNLETRQIRTTALQQSFLSYLLGAVILAMTINLIIGLGNFTT
jgi:uncharacterized membrane protein